MGRKAGTGHIHFAADTAVYISEEAVGGLGDRVDLYERGELLAFVGSPTGAYRAYRRPGGRSRQVAARGPLQYLLSRFPDAGGVRPAWPDPAGRAVLTGPEELRGTPFGEGFRRLPLEEISAHRCCRIRRDRLTVSSALPRRVSILAQGGMLALVRDKEGPYRREREEGETFLRSPALAEYCREVWGARPPLLRALPQGAVLSPDFAALAGLEGLEDFRPLSLEDRERRTATLRRDRSILLSPEAARLLGRTASVYACGGTLALRSDRSGDVAIQRGEGGGGVVRAARLYQQAAMAFPGVETFHLIPDGGLLVLSPEEGRRDPLPEEYFCRLLVGEAALV